MSMVLAGTGRVALRVAVAVGIVALLVRMPAVGRFMTVDEQTWMMRSNDFINNLRIGNLEGTFQGTHPGATGMWLMGSGIALQEWRLDTKLNNDNLILFHKAAVFPIVVAFSLLLAIVGGLLTLLVGWPAALLAGIFMASEPYLVGMSQVAHLDALQSVSMLAALLSWIVYFVRPQKKLLYATGVLFGVALGLKLLLAFWLVPSFIGAALLLIWQQGRWSSWRTYVLTFLKMILIATVTFILLWPTVLSKKDLQIGYLARDTKTIVTDEHGSYENTEGAISSWTFYVRTVLGRVTPNTQLWVAGYFLFSILYVAFRIRRHPELRDTRHEIIWALLVYAIGYLVFISLAAKKADRYALPALLVLPLVGGYGLARFLSYFWQVRPRKRLIVGVIAVLFTVSALLSSINWSPHAIAYSNPYFPDIRPLPQQGWGEGLEAAAAWLNERPEAETMYIASWYPSVVHTFFHGHTLRLSSRQDYRVQYIVTYRNMGGRVGDDQASDVLDEVRGKQPVFTYSIEGVPYVWVYETGSVGNFLKTIGEVVGRKEVGQTVKPTATKWSSIEIGFATFGSRANTEDVVLHVRETPASTRDIRTVRVNARDIQDNKWHRFEFEPISDAADKEFYVVITSPTSNPGNAVTVRYTDRDVRVGQLYVDGQPKEGDLAYRIGE